MGFSDLFIYFVALCIVGLGMLAILWIMRMYWQSKLREWAAAQGFRLVSFRGARFQEGPQRLRQRRSERMFRVAIEDNMRARRSGWIMFAGIWGVRAPDPPVRIIWDEWDD